MTSHADTRATNRMYGHPSSRDFRAKERGEKKPQDPVAAARVRHRDETARDVAEQKRERGALANDRAKALQKDPLGRRDHEFAKREKEMRERHRDQDSKRVERHRAELESIARKHPVA
jgi:hypothetical protein